MESRADFLRKLKVKRNGIEYYGKLLDMETTKRPMRRIGQKNSVNTEIPLTVIENGQEKVNKEIWKKFTIKGDEISISNLGNVLVNGKPKRKSEVLNANGKPTGSHFINLHATSYQIEDLMAYKFNGINRVWNKPRNKTLGITEMKQNNPKSRFSLRVSRGNNKESITIKTASSKEGLLEYVNALRRVRFHYEKLNNTVLSLPELKKKVIRQVEGNGNAISNYEEKHKQDPRKTWEREHHLKYFNKYFVGGDIITLSADALILEEQMMKHPKARHLHCVENDPKVFARLNNKFDEVFPDAKRKLLYKENIIDVIFDAYNIACYNLDYCGFYQTFREDILEAMELESSKKGTLIFLTLSNSRLDSEWKSDIYINGLPADTAEEFRNSVKQNILVMQDIYNSVEGMDGNVKWECLSNTYYKENMMQMVWYRTN